jgi:hypothetical protein
VPILGLSPSGELTLEEARVLFSSMLSLPIAYIDEDHAEVLALVALHPVDDLHPTGEGGHSMAEKLVLTFSANDIDRYFTQMYVARTVPQRQAAASKIQGGLRGRNARVAVQGIHHTGIVAPRPDERKVRRIIDELDLDPSGQVTMDEANLIFSELMDLELEGGEDGRSLTVTGFRHDNHREVVAFVGDQGTMEEKICSHFTKLGVDQYFQAMFQPYPWTITQVLPGHVPSRLRQGD